MIKKTYLLMMLGIFMLVSCTNEMQLYKKQN
jgi:hypothetical protein